MKGLAIAKSTFSSCNSTPSLLISFKIIFFVSSVRDKLFISIYSFPRTILLSLLNCHLLPSIISSLFSKYNLIPLSSGKICTIISSRSIESIIASVFTLMLIVSPLISAIISIGLNDFPSTKLESIFIINEPSL